ncbi:nuclear transport factor 2 family protein [Roseateles sp. NT4]|uniref:nuclear transport factor 2 family protein n=1 Tax=Roseateles sp. NT4 TaxID=3453715 RepID=UPI003EED85E3
MNPSTVPSAVEANLDAFLDAFNELDFERFCACMADHVSLFAPVAAQTGLIQGKPAVEAHFRAVFEHEAPTGPQIRPQNVHSTAMGEEAALVTFEFLRGDGSIGRRSLVFQYSGGDWKIAHIHASNGDPP